MTVSWLYFDCALCQYYSKPSLKHAPQMGGGDENMLAVVKAAKVLDPLQ